METTGVLYALLAMAYWYHRIVEQLPEHERNKAKASLILCLVYGLASLVYAQPALASAYEIGIAAMRPMLSDLTHFITNVGGIWPFVCLPDAQGERRGSSAMLAVVPCSVLASLLLEDSAVKEERRDYESRWKKGPHATIEVAEPPTKGDNPQHKEDFNSLLHAAARKRPQDDQT